MDKTAVGKSQVIDLDQDILILVAGVKAGRDDDFEKLKLRYRPLVNELCQSFEASGAGKAGELLEDAHRALLKAALSFDETKEKITFGLYAKICIRNALISVRRSKLAKKNTAEKPKAEKENGLKLSSLRGFRGLEAEEIVSLIDSRLSSYESKVLSEFLAGKRAGDVARELGASEKSVYNALFRIRTKARELSEERSQNE